MALSLHPRDMAPLVAMAAVRVLSPLMDSSPPTLDMASSQLLAVPREGKGVFVVSGLHQVLLGSGRYHVVSGPHQVVLGVGCHFKAQ